MVLYFMHLRYDRPFLLVVFLGCLGFVVLFISLVLTDAAAYHPSVNPGEAPDMQKVHTPLGIGRGHEDNGDSRVTRCYCLSGCGSTAACPYFGAN